MAYHSKDPLNYLDDLIDLRGRTNGTRILTMVRKEIG